MMTSVQSLFSYTANASLFFLWVCMSEKTSERENPLLFSRLIRQSSTTLATSALISKNRPYHYHNLSFFESLASSCRERKKTFVLGGLERTAEEERRGERGSPNISGRILTNKELLMLASVRTIQHLFVIS